MIIIHRGSPRGSLLQSSSPTVRGDRSETLSSKGSGGTVKGGSREDLHSLEGGSSGYHDNQKTNSSSTLHVQQTSSTSTKSNVSLNADSPDGILSVMGERGEGEGQEEERAAATCPQINLTMPSTVAISQENEIDRLAVSTTPAGDELRQPYNR